jgi:hypothetical protein
MVVKRKEDQTLTTLFYSKPTATQRIISYKSNHHITRKIYTALGLIHRIYNIRTENNEKTKQYIITNILQKNEYPIIVINSLYKRYKSNQNTTWQMSTNNITVYRSISYIKSLSEKVAKMLKSTNQDLVKAFKNKHSNGVFTQLKDQTTHAKKQM